MKKLILPALALLSSAACSHPKLTESQEYYVGRSVAANAMFDKGGTYIGLYSDKNL